jgi:signal transduction histidine kinase/ActR/RegA family two-component response regulator
MIAHPAVRWLVAASLVTVAAALNMGFMRLTEGAYAYMLFYPALIGSALLCGRAPSYAALLATVLLVSYFWLPPVGSFWIVPSPARWGLLGFVAVSALLLETALAAARGAERLERQRSELKTMLDLIPVGIGVAEDREARSIVASPGLASMLGLPLGRNVSRSGADAASLPFRTLRDGRELDREELPMQVACRTGREVRDFEMTLAFDDGRQLDLMVSAAPLFDAEGEVRGAIGAHVDITKLKSAQRTLDESSRQKDEFLATLAHELRNPMAPITYAAAVLGPDAPPAVIAQARDTIQRQAAHMGRLLDDLLDVSRIHRNAIELKVRPLDLVAVVRAAIDAVRGDLERRMHRLECACPPEPVWVAGDPDRLHQVVLNLLANAIKYTDRGGRVRVSVDVEHRQARVRVVDDGVGMAPESIPKMFDLFTQADPGRAGGLGIGLSVVRRLVELHGGQVSARSDGPGTGAEFTVRLPVIAPPAESPPEASGTLTLFRQAPRILVVDDSRDAADTLAAFLRSHGLSVQVAYDGAAATRAAEDSHPEAVVLDLGMPGMTGYDVARWIRSRPWGSAVRLVAVTGWGQARDRARAKSAGFDDHFVKPVQPTLLLGRLQEVFPDGENRRA